MLLSIKSPRSLYPGHSNRRIDYGKSIQTSIRQAMISYRSANVFILRKVSYIIQNNISNYGDEMLNYRQQDLTEFR
jgi:hypothetical protein